MWIQRFRTLMEPATRTAGEELSGLSGHIQTVLRTLVCNLIDLGSDCGVQFSLPKDPREPLFLYRRHHRSNYGTGACWRTPPRQERTPRGEGDAAKAYATHIRTSPSPPRNWLLLEPTQGGAPTQRHRSAFWSSPWYFRICIDKADRLLSGHLDQEILLLVATAGVL